MSRMDRVRNVMSDWPFWITVAFFGLAAVTVSLFVLFGKTGREEAQRAVTAKSAAQAQVSGCYTAVKNAPVVAGFIHSHEAIIENGLISNQAAINASPGDPLNPIRRKSIVRLTAAKRNADQLRRLIEATTPTLKSCNELAAKLAVKPPHHTK